MMCVLGDCLQSLLPRPGLAPRRSILAVLALTLALAGCAASDGTGPPDTGAPVASVTVTPRAAMLWEAGDQIRFVARVVDQDGREMPDVELVWSSSEPDVAGVDASGLVTATGNGWTIIHASAGGVTGGADAVIVTPDSPRDRRDCIACHAPEYAAQHGSSTPTTCLECHEGRTFAGVTADHVTASGGFELLGAHASLSCQSCHEADGTPKFPGVADGDCIACHQTDYDGQHGGSGFPTTCLECHTTDSFAGATVDHSVASGGFELLGAHASLSCQSCHEADGTPKFPGVADGDCIACHQTDYDGQHGGSGFPTTCLECHTTDSFSGASFDHDALFFPISSGKHQGRWSGCETCHTDPNDYSTFTCFSCHQHSQDRMDDKHDDVSGYAYDSAACYSCHPDGREP